MTAAGKSGFDEYLAQEVQRCRGVYFPVKTELLRRLMIREARCDELHPNPDDEFCAPGRRTRQTNGRRAGIAAAMPALLPAFSPQHSGPAAAGGLRSGD